MEVALLSLAHRADRFLRGLFSAGVKGWAGADRVAGPLAARQQLDAHRLEVAHALVGADRLADREDANRRVALLDHVAEHVEVRVVGHAGLANPAHSGPYRRLRAVDRLALAEVELVARAPARGAPLTAQLDPLSVVRSLADVDHQPHGPALVLE